MTHAEHISRYAAPQSPGMVKVFVIDGECIIDLEIPLAMLRAAAGQKDYSIVQLACIDPALSALRARRQEVAINEGDSTQKVGDDENRTQVRELRHD